jgi:hypothetical protein
MSNLNATHISAQFWVQLEGRLLEGKYILGDCLHATDTHGIFQTTITGAYVRSASIKISALEGDKRQDQLALWELVRTFDHPNLIRILMTGRTDIDGVAVTYAVMEPSDESLAGVFRERPLDSLEAKQVLESILEGLKYIHAHNLVHGAIEPRNILAVGESIKISTDSLQRPGESGESPDERANEAPEVQISGRSAASDIYATGATLFEALTQQLPTTETLEQIELPRPFGEIIEHCLELNPEKRWTSKEIWAALRAQPVIAAKAVNKPVAPAVNPEPDYQAPVPAYDAPIPADQTPANVEAPEETPPVEEEPAPEDRKIFLVVGDEEEKARRPVWPFAAAGLVLIVFLFWSMFRKGPADSKPVVGPEVQSSSAKPASPAATPRVVAPASEASPPAAATQANWRVVAFTYLRESDAVAKVKAINAKRPELKPEVFAPNPGRSPYLVSLGGQMTVDDSKRFRRKAISLGMPRDTYTQNFRH